VRIGLAEQRGAALIGQLMNIQKMLRQAQEMQAKASKMQETLAEQIFESSVGGGKVTATANGAGEVLTIKISPDVIDPEDPEMLEDMVLTAVREAVGKGRDYQQEEMRKLTSGMGLPPGLGF
jgi:DNA-binding YbaB/EbfC family protein